MEDLRAFVLENYTTVHHRCPNTVAGQLNPTQLSFGDTCAWRDRAQNGKKHCGLSPTDTMLILLPEVMKPTGGWQEGRKHHCTVAPSSIMLLLLLRCHSLPRDVSPAQTLPNSLSVASRVVKHFHLQSQNCDPCSFLIH